MPRHEPSMIVGQPGDHRVQPGDPALRDAKEGHAPDSTLANIPPVGAERIYGVQPTPPAGDNAVAATSPKGGESPKSAFDTHGRDDEISHRGLR
ncbi:MAG TPA: hypothetical protein VMU67_13890 [Steroidobacteraceae bacterium]|nr:hypothetical protein [Steroidobacteraceae bacterium]